MAEKNHTTQPYERVEQSRKEIALRNFIGGLVWGAGSVIGAAVVVVLLGWIISTSRQIPFVGDVVDVVVDQAEQELEESRSFSNPQ